MPKCLTQEEKKAPKRLEPYLLPWDVMCMFCSTYAYVLNLWENISSVNKCMYLLNNLHHDWAVFAMETGKAMTRSKAQENS